MFRAKVILCIKLTLASRVEQDIENWGQKQQLPPTNPVCPPTYWGHLTFLPLPS